MLRSMLFTLAVLCALCACTSRTAVQRRYIEAVRGQREGRDVDARLAYGWVLKDSPAFEGARNNLAVIDVGDGNLDQAVALIQQELQTTPTLRAARINEVLLLLIQGENEPAARRSLSLIGTFGGDSMAHLLRGVALLRLDTDHAAAHESLTNALKSETTSIRARAAFARGVLAARSSRWREAADDFAMAARLRRDAVAHFNRALALAHLGEHDEATDALSLSAALDHEAAAVPHLTALILYTSGKSEAAHEALTRTRKLEPKRAGLDLLEGLLEYRAGRYDRAAAALEKATQSTATSADVWFTLGLTHLELDQLEKSRDAFAQAARLAPSDAESVHNRDALTRLLSADE